MKILPRKLAEVPIIINMMVKPITKPRVLLKASNFLSLIWLSIVLPVMYIMYTGIMGRIHGEKKDKNPAPKAIGMETSVSVIGNPPNTFYTPIPYNYTQKFFAVNKNTVNLIHGFLSHY